MGPGPLQLNQYCTSIPGSPPYDNNVLVHLRLEYSYVHLSLVLALVHQSVTRYCVLRTPYSVIIIIIILVTIILHNKYSVLCIQKRQSCQSTCMCPVATSQTIMQ